MNKKICLFGLLPLVALSSCGEGGTTYEATLHIENEGVTSRVYTPDEVNLVRTVKDYDEDSYLDMRAMQSTGEAKLLVIPVLLPENKEIHLDEDETADNEQVRADLQEVFFGEEGSVASFYRRSSFGKLSISGTVAPYFDATSLGYETIEDIDSDATYLIATGAVEAYERAGGDLREFDANSDGVVDGVWLIYSAHNYTYDYNGTGSNNLYAYTAWANQGVEGSVEDPIIKVFGWASYDFMYGEDGLDAHTYIHEMGHFLGLQDYYSGDSYLYSPMGKLDMMDGNVLDHSSYSKLLLGWIKPTLVYGSADITLSSMDVENSCIVLQGDEAEVSADFDPYGEYILLELYTPEGINGDDVSSSYGGYRYVDVPGVRIYHVDKRLFKVSSDMSVSLYDGGELGDGEGLLCPIFNSRNYDTYNYYFGLPMEYNLYDEIRLIEANGKDTFSYGGYQSTSSYFMEGDSFSKATHGAFFEGGLLNDGSAFGYEVEVASL